MTSLFRNPFQPITLGVMLMVEKIREALLLRGLTQDALEQSVGLPRGRISKWAGGQGEPTARQAWRIARFLVLPVEYLIDDEMMIAPAPIDYEERAMIDTFHALGLDLKEAIRRLHNPATGITQPKPLPPEAETHSRSKGRAG